jgi:hypothetical protein
MIASVPRVLGKKCGRGMKAEFDVSTSAHNIANDVCSQSFGGQFHKWFGLIAPKKSILHYVTAGGTAAEINTKTKGEKEILGATTSVDILDAAGAAGAAKDAKEWGEVQVQARFLQKPMQD